MIAHLYANVKTRLMSVCVYPVARGTFPSGGESRQAKLYSFGIILLKVETF